MSKRNNFDTNRLGSKRRVRLNKKFEISDFYPMFDMVEFGSGVWNKQTLSSDSDPAKRKITGKGEVTNYS